MSALYGPWARAGRSWHFHRRGDTGEPKTKSSRRVLALGQLTPRYRAWIAGMKDKSPNALLFPNPANAGEPLYERVRSALKNTPRACKPEGASKDDPGLDSKGFGMHALWRANITWRQSVGGSSIEASIIAGHSKLDLTIDYTIVEPGRHEALTRRIQQKRKAAGKKAPKVQTIRELAS